MSKTLGGGGSRTTENYVEPDLDDFDTARGDASPPAHTAGIDNQQDVITIKDAIHDGNLAIADITRHATSGSTIGHIIDDLQQVIREVDDNIAQKGDDQVVIAPMGTSISRQKLNG